jgi:hypothetical protein
VKTNLLIKLVNRISLYSKIILRTLKYKFINIEEGEEFFLVERDTTFFNSLITITYHFPSLIWAHFPGVDKKIDNGKIVLNASKLEYPYIVRVKTKYECKRYSIESAEIENFLNSKLYKIEEFEGFNRMYKRPNIFSSPAFSISNHLNYKNQNFFFKREKSRISNSLKINKISHSNFKTNDYI